MSIAQKLETLCTDKGVVLIKVDLSLGCMLNFIKLGGEKTDKFERDKTNLTDTGLKLT